MCYSNAKRRKLQVLHCRGPWPTENTMIEQLEDWEWHFTVNLPIGIHLLAFWQTLADYKFYKKIQIYSRATWCAKLMAPKRNFYDACAGQLFWPLTACKSAQPCDQFKQAGTWSTCVAGSLLQECDDNIGSKRKSVSVATDLCRRKQSLG